jgi:probable F420-dependent oxidoreductase
MDARRPLGLVLRDLLPPAGPRALIPARALLDLAVLADRRGYDSVWVPEGTGREATSTLGAAAAVTSHIRLGSGILTIFTRPPGLAAMAAATLADLSGGRFILGLGVGHPHLVGAAFGARYRRPLAAMREYVAIVRQALAGGQVTVAGRVFRTGALRLESRPRYPVPIYLAALGEGMLRLAGEVADGVILNWMPPSRVRWAAEIVRDAARRHGRDPSAITVACYVRAACGDAAAVMPVVRRLVATYAAMPAYARMFEAAGLAPDVAAVRAAWARGGVDAAAQAVTDEFASQVVVRSSGVASHTAHRAAFDGYYDAGADLTIAYPVPVGADAAASMRDTIEGFAPRDA